jgi:hypothetical protein
MFTQQSVKARQHTHVKSVRLIKCSQNSVVYIFVYSVMGIDLEFISDLG